MNKEAEKTGCELLKELEFLLGQDPFIDELGFLHPSQMSTLDNSETGDSKSSEAQRSKGSFHYNSHAFWIKDHKLAISVSILHTLYEAAKSAYLSSSEQYKSLARSLETSGSCSHKEERECNSVALTLSSAEAAVMRYSKVLVLLCSGYATAWNSRRLVVSQKAIGEVYLSELQLSELVLSFAPKCEQAWSYRRWLIRLIMNSGLCSKQIQLILEQESKIVQRVAERTHMNYRAWRHRCWLVQYMPISLVLSELNNGKGWAELHVGDNCSFHYRRCLLLQLQQTRLSTPKVHDIPSKDFSSQSESVQDLVQTPNWKEELDWNKHLIECYMDREALWIHRRFLFHVVIENVHKNGSCDTYCHEFLKFVEEEREFIKLCFNHIEMEYDITKQKDNAITYKAWMLMKLNHIKECPRLVQESNKIEGMTENVSAQRRIILKALFSI